ALHELCLTGQCLGRAREELLLPRQACAVGRSDAAAEADPRSYLPCLQPSALGVDEVARERGAVDARVAGLDARLLQKHPRQLADARFPGGAVPVELGGLGDVTNGLGAR